MKGRSVIVGVTGGIAAYKVAELVRLLVKEDIHTRVAMTANAAQFVSPVTFEALSGNAVIWDMYGQEGGSMAHISWGQEADLVIIAPATANFLAKMSHGIADDFLSTMVIAATAKMLVCPSMNDQMLNHPAVQENITILKRRGLTVMEPGEGQLACGSEGMGRLPEPEEIFQTAVALLSHQDLKGLKIIVTAGATLEPIDPVRYITNRSSGKMGYALARAAFRRGAAVTLISGPTALNTPQGVIFRPVKTAEEMLKAVFENIKHTDIVIKAAAVADYRPRQQSLQKIKKGPDSLTLELVKTPDILAQLGRAKAEYPYVLVGFAAETEDLIRNAEQKLASKNLDLIVANDVSRSDAGFEIDTNDVKLIFSDGHTEDSGLMTKNALADLVIDRAKAVLEGRGEGARGS